jgi:hypothetical protein
MTDDLAVGSPAPQMFPLGALTVDDDVHDVLAMHRLSLEPLLRRHAQADWGDVAPELAGRNGRAIFLGWWIKSLYRLPDSSDVIGIRTNADRTATHVRVEWDAPQGLQP